MKMRKEREKESSFFFSHKKSDLFFLFFFFLITHTIAPFFQTSTNKQTREAESLGQRGLGYNHTLLSLHSHLRTAKLAAR
jgi:hypothetical protein